MPSTGVSRVARQVAAKAGRRNIDQRRAAPPGGNSPSRISCCVFRSVGDSTPAVIHQRASCSSGADDGALSQSFAEVSQVNACEQCLRLVAVTGELVNANWCSGLENKPAFSAPPASMATRRPPASTGVPLESIGAGIIVIAADPSVRLWPAVATVAGAGPDGRAPRPGVAAQQFGAAARRHQAPAPPGKRSPIIWTS